MTKTVACLSVALCAMAAFPENENLIAPKPGASKLAGRAGECADACIRSRAYSDWARGEMYEETVNAFRTHADDRDGHYGWQSEYWGKTMLCYAGAVAYTHDKALADWVRTKTGAFLKEFQWPNGYLSTYGQEDFLRRKPESPDGVQHACFNVWGQKYSLWALVDIYRFTGDEKALDGAVKLLDHLIAQLERLGTSLDRTGYWHGISSMSMLRPILELYRIAKKPAYLALAKDIVRAMDAEGDDPGHILRDAFRPEPIHTWHGRPGFWAKAYEIQSCLEGLADYYRLTGEKRALDGVLAYYGHLEREELNPMGSAGHFDHFYGAAQQHNGMTELCDVTHWIRLNRELLLVTGGAKYADAIEKAFYNAFLAGVTRDGRWGAHIVRSHGTRHLWAPPQTGMFHHQCCPDNMMRTYFDIAGSVAAKGTDGSIAVALYGDACAEFGDDRVEISGGYPWGDAPVVVRVRRATAGTVRFRVPGWSKSFRVNGRVVAAADGWHETSAPAGESTWTLGFDLSPRVVPAVCGEERLLPPSPQGSHLDDVGPYTVHFMEWYTPEMAGMARTAPAVRVMRGPLVLAKGRLAGTSRIDTLTTFAYENGGGGWRAALEPQRVTAANAGVPKSWKLTLSRGVESKVFSVSDYASVSNVEDADNWFSLWF